MNTRQMPPIGGAVAPGFEPVREAFARNFSERGELGAACAAYHRGAPVVDIWGGHRDAARREVWEKDTLVLVSSVTKGLAAMAVAVALSRGLLALDAPVATYRPEFARHGKGRITVRQLLAHQAGVPTVDAPLRLARMADRAFLADAIARQAPLWEPRTRRGCHYLTIGWGEDELIRRVDPHGRGIRQFFADEVARPLGLELYLRLPPEVPDGRIATIRAFRAPQMLLHLGASPRGMVLAYFRPGSLTARVLGNPRLGSSGTFDTRGYRALGLPAAGGIGRVRDVARAFGALAVGGHELGLAPPIMAELAAPVPAPPDGDADLIRHANVAYALGYIKPTATVRFGRGERAFGSEGAGGAFADPDAGVGFAYAPNRMGFHLFDDPRERRGDRAA